ncbi:hypothetical protein IZ6_05030 [Terrihabitans soli]|uniref:Periplasmic protein-like protein n=1 Tax=Terrihabitans soli TaxID=708113 RepID=A0A6S6QTI6_9HYPH|nr:hypothetical protein [Terrihabitans soli]BCJ89768.1 hypothetical protein IZ6_05030 [Terrihabitans soli]
MHLKPVLSAFAVLLFVSAATAEPMHFRVSEIGCPKACTKVLLGEGEIAFTTAGAFRSVRRKTGALPVLLHSRGGDLPGGLNLGLAFRKTRSSVAVAPGGDCFSACAFALFGGTERKVHRGGQLGVHQVIFAEDGSDPQGRPTFSEKHSAAIIGHLIRYARQMGVSPDVVEIALATPYDENTIFSSRELKRYGIVTSD